MQHLSFRLGRRRYLLCRPEVNPDGKPTGYGNLVRHVEQAMRTAAALEATLFLVRPAHPVNPALYELDSPDLRIVGQGDRRAPVFRAIWRVAAPLRYGAPAHWLVGSMAASMRPIVARGKQMARRRGWRGLDRALDRVGHAVRDVSHRYEKLVTAQWHAVFAEARDRARATDSKRRPVRLRLCGRAQSLVDELILVAGIEPGRPLATLHVREAGFRQRGATRQRDIDRIREARIEAYAAAIDGLVGHGYQVVRIGDPSMTPCQRPGVIDLATAPWRTGAFELWAVFNSRFFIASDSGPYFLAQLANVPALAINVIQVGYYTLRPHDRYVCKRVYDRIERRHLSISEMLTEQFIRNPLDFERYEWLDNTAEDIRDAVEDFLFSLERPAGARTPAQERHDRLLADVAAQWRPEWRSRRSLLIRRGGPGTISPRFAARYLDIEATTRLEPTSGMR